MIIWLVLLAAVSAAGWMRLRVDTSLEPLLPQNSAARKTVLFLRDSSFTSKGVLWFRLTGDGTLANLVGAADQVEKRLDPKLIKRVIRPPLESDAMEQVFGLLDHAGEMLNEADLVEVEKATEPYAVKKRMREIYMQLVQPQGSFMQQVIRKDPLGVNSRVLARLYALTSSLGYRMEIKNGHFVHPDGRQLLLIFETSASVTSLDGSEALAKHLEALRASPPPGVAITPISPQIHTYQNDQLMRRDMRWIGSMDIIGFLLFFIVVCRDWRVAAVFILPAITIVIAIGVCALIYPNLSVMVMGLTATMAGSAVDYGIFVYTAIKKGHDWRDDIRRIRLHLLLSLLTTLGVFFALMFSNIPAFRQLGWLTSISLILAMFAAVFVLPVVIRPGGKILAMGSGIPLRDWGRKMVSVTVFAGILFLAALYCARTIRFDSDVSRLDGVSADVRLAESNFQRTWGRSDAELALVVVSGKSLEEAEEASDDVYRKLSIPFADKQFVSLTSFWPWAATRAANIERWKQFWSPQRVEKLKQELAVAGQPYGFAANAYDPFFQGLSAAPDKDQSRQILASIEDQFIAKSNGEWQILSYFPDTAENVAAATALLHNRPDVQVISRRAIGQAFAESAASETRILVGVSLAFIITALLVLTRSIAKSILVMLPATAGIVAMLAALTMMGLSMNVVSVIAAIVVLGLCSDYGIFAVFSWDEGETVFGQGMTSMHLSSVTTLIGAAALLFAKHPALFLVGVSLTSGLLTGYLMAFLVVPGICYLLDRYRAPRAA
jgi:predicted exporter